MVSPEPLHLHAGRGGGDLRSLSQTPRFEPGSEPERCQGIRRKLHFSLGTCSRAYPLSTWQGRGRLGAVSCPGLPFLPPPSAPLHRQLGWSYVGVPGPKATSVCLWLRLLSLNQGKFREQFKAAFSCCLPSLGPCVSLKVPSPRSSASHKSLSLQSRCSVSKVSEHVLLTSVTTVLP